GPAEQPRLVSRVCHERRALGHVVADAPQIHDVVVIGLAKVKPDRSGGRYDIRLGAAVGDHPTDTRPRAQMLAAELVTARHERHGVEGAPAAPRSAGSMGA